MPWKYSVKNQGDSVGEIVQFPAKEHHGEQAHIMLWEGIPMEQSFWLSWSKAAGLRAVRAMAQTALAALGTGAAFYTVDWKAVGLMALMAGIISVLTSLAGLPEVQKP